MPGGFGGVGRADGSSGETDSPYVRYIPGFVLPVEAEGIAVAVTTEVVAVTTEVVGMGVGMGVVVIGTPPTGTTLLTGMLLGQMLLPQLKGSSLQEAKRLLPVMQTLLILIQVILNTHQ